MGWRILLYDGMIFKILSKLFKEKFGSKSNSQKKRNLGFQVSQDLCLQKRERIHVGFVSWVGFLYYSDLTSGLPIDRLIDGRMPLFDLRALARSFFFPGRSFYRAWLRHLSIILLSRSNARFSTIGRLANWVD